MLSYIFPNGIVLHLDPLMVSTRNTESELNWLAHGSVVVVQSIERESKIREPVVEVPRSALSSATSYNILFIRVYTDSRHGCHAQRKRKQVFL